MGNVQINSVNFVIVCPRRTPETADERNVYERKALARRRFQSAVYRTVIRRRAGAAWARTTLRQACAWLGPSWAAGTISRKSEAAQTQRSFTEASCATVGSEHVAYEIKQEFDEEELADMNPFVMGRGTARGDYLCNHCRQPFT